MVRVIFGFNGVELVAYVSLGRLFDVMRNIISSGVIFIYFLVFKC